MTPRTVYVMASLVTKLPSEAICATLGKLLSRTFYSFQVHRKTAAAELAVQGYQACLLGFVLLTDEPIHVFTERAGAFVHDPGNASLDMQVVLLPENLAAEFWATIGTAPTLMCHGLMALFPWDNAHGQESLSASGGDA